MVLAHVNELSGALDSCESSLGNSFGRARESDYGTVGRLARIHVQDLYPWFFTFCLCSASDNCCDDGIYDILITTFAEIRYAFDNLFHNICQD